MPKTLSSRILTPAERIRGLTVGMYVDTDGKRVVFKAHSSYLNCDCGTVDLDQDRTISSHLVDEKVGNPTLHRTDCRTYPWRQRRNVRKTMGQFQKRTIEEKARMRKMRRKQDVEISVKPVIDTSRNCICDRVGLYEKRLFQGSEKSQVVDAAERRRIKDHQVRMLGEPCEVHDLCCEECHYGLWKYDWRNSQEKRLEYASTNNEPGPNSTSIEPLQRVRCYSPKLLAGPAQASEAIKACSTHRTLPKSAVKQGVQHGPERLARDILRAAGIHPSLPPLNWHLGVTKISNATY